MFPKGIRYFSKILVTENTFLIHLCYGHWQCTVDFLSLWKFCYENHVNFMMTFEVETIRLIFPNDLTSHEHIYIGGESIGPHFSHWFILQAITLCRIGNHTTVHRRTVRVLEGFWPLTVTQLLTTRWNPSSRLNLMNTNAPLATGSTGNVNAMMVRW